MLLQLFVLTLSASCVISEYQSNVTDFAFGTAFSHTTAVTLLIDLARSGRWLVPNEGCDTCNVNVTKDIVFNISTKGFSKTDEHFEYEINDKYDIFKGHVRGYFGRYEFKETAS